MISLEVVLLRPGGTPLRLTPALESFRWSTAAVGGFSAASFAVPGDPAQWRRDIPHLSLARIVLDTHVIWEGQVEDITVKLLDGSSAATVTCFGLQRRLAETSVRRIWSKRDIAWQEATLPIGSAISGVTRAATLDVATGNFDQADLTKSGVQIAGTGVSVASGEGNFAEWVAPSGVNFVLWLGTLTRSGTDAAAGRFTSGWWAFESSAWAFKTSSLVSGTWSVTLSNATAVRLAAYNNSGGAAVVAADSRSQFYDMRLLGTSVTEDTSGGFYGGTILRDLLALVPDLTIGVIDQGSDYTIQAIERSVRAAALDIVNEVARYYNREWAVWEDGRFDWKTVNKDEPQWVVRLAELSDGSELTFSVDGIARTLYLLYVDAASGIDAEQSASSTAQPNPYTKQGKTKDLLVSPGFLMTSSSASQLASKLVSDSGNYVPVTGRLILSALQPVRRATGSQLPALMIRSGDNIAVADLPKSDLYATGRDGETLFHIVSTEADLGSGTVTLEVEGQTNRTDVLLARLAASTRILTG